MVDLFGPGAELPATDTVARDHLAIPMSAVLTERQVDEVVSAARSAVVSGAT
jgi:dTDP-4-amino-4,6-dideoxygalactose transaminase